MNRIKVSKASGETARQLPKRTVWQTFVDVYTEFAAETSIHGLKYTTQRKLKIDGVIWFTIVSISIVCAGVLASRFYERHQAASMRTTVVSTQYPAWDFQLPAVTLCHGTMALVQKVDRLLKERGTLLPGDLTGDKLKAALGYIRGAIEPSRRFLTHLKTLQTFMDANSMTMDQFLNKVAPNCSEYLIACRWRGREERCENLMSPSMTPYGLCCSFNYHFAMENPKRERSDNYEDYYSMTYGAHFALSFLMNPFLDGRISSTFYGDGIKVLIHEPLTYPGAAAIEFVAPSGYETIASVHGNRLTSSSDVLNLSRDVRSCVNADEQVPPYRFNNCYTRCREEIIRSRCRCLPFYSFSISKDVPICGFFDIDCLARNALTIHSLRLDDPRCRCPPECSKNTFELATTTIPLNAAEFSPSSFYKQTSRYPNATALHITLASQLMTLQRRDVVQSWINLLSSLGGVFSLFLGCSFISLIEILYFFCILLPSKLLLNRKRKQPGSKR